ncbi:excinuclease ABC subunit UvrC [Hydrogenoanaerobacterium sp.]|uniref:excinuclease ABC subunit UvrC n=1 Tax=Hydrogenoanaerobacterium sp. TaxID=2953763 RepID=UPI002896AD20|nr:excinuclease ABC subunit UvrC [Hydrogenoanaerobacterium sp.]
MDNDRLPYLRDKVKKLPLDPGCYIMKDQAGIIIYIGKAKALKNRVSSYFRSVEKHTDKVYKMVESVYDFEYIVTASEFEALVLECSLIKEYSPKYNILLKDDKGYFYVKISKPPWSRITAEKQKLDDGATYLGPYTSSFVVGQTVDETNKIFSLPTCSRKFPQEFRKGRPCLNFHIKQCMGVCRGRITEEEYQQVIDSAVEFIKSGSTQAVDKLTAEMAAASENLEFEKAARLRDRINAINRITEHQQVIDTKADNQDIIGFAQSDHLTCAVVLKFRNQRLVDKDDYIIRDAGDLQQFRGEFITGYYSSHTDRPKIVSVDGEFDDMSMIEQFLTQQAGRKVTLHVPKRSESYQLTQMARNNAAQRLSHETERTGKEVAVLDELARLLGLKSTPVYIEAYDISNIGSDTMVAGMVVFENARPKKDAYKKFSIKTQFTPDDYACMREVLTRRFNRYFEEKETGRGFGKKPDLILLDGGKGHVGVIRPLLNEMGLGDIPVFGMVKDDKHKTRAIAEDGGEIAINSHRTAFTLVTKIQDEVHRFSITYSRSKHKATAFELSLTKVAGIGENRAKALFKHFKTVKAMKAATCEELSQAPGMTAKVAENLYNFLHDEE